MSSETALLIDQEFRALVPPLQEHEYSDLEASLLREGNRVPIDTWRGYIIDGHNRYDLCYKHNIPLKPSNELSFSDRSEAMIWIIRNQFGRRNLNNYQRSVLALKLESLFAEKAHTREYAGKKLDPVQNSAQGKTREALAKVAHVSHDTIAKVKVIEQQAPAEVKEQCRTGEISINQGYQQIKRQEKETKREERRQANAELVKATPNPLEANAKFATILIDPPWDWGDEGDINQLGRAKPDYATMPYEQLLTLKPFGIPIIDLTDIDCHIYAWVTNRSMPKIFGLLDSWGFRYITLLTWPKPSFGMGNYFRGQTEHIAFGVKGSQMLKRKDVSTLLPAWPRGSNGHSSKPVEVYDFIESCSPGPYLELFARDHRDGWTSWGEPI